MPFSYVVTATDATGTNAQYLQTAKAMVETAMAEYAKYISGQGTIEVAVQIDSLYGAAQSLSIVGTSNVPHTVGNVTIVNALAPIELTTGVDGNGSASDITIKLNPNFFTNYWIGDRTQIPTDKIDGVSKLIGGLKKAFDMFTNTDAVTGKEALSPVGTTMDDKLFHLIQKVGSQWYFVGQNAKAVYGGPVPIGEPDYQGTVDLGVLSRALSATDVFADKAAYALPGDPKAYESLLPGKAYGLSALDLAVMKDLNPALQISVPVIGTNGNDKFINQRGLNEFIDGAGGRDTFIVTGTRAQYTATLNADGSADLQTNGTNEVDHLVNVERIKFDDGVLILDGGPNGAIAYRMYQAAFARIPDEPGLLVQAHNGLDVYVGLKIAAGASTAAPYSPTISISEAHYLADMLLAQNFINSAEFQARYGANPSDRAFVTLLYQNVLNRIPDEGGYTVQVGALQAGMSRAQLLTNFAESTENLALTGQNTAHGLWSIYADSAFA